MAMTDHSGAGRWGPEQSINRQLHDLVVPQLFVLSTGLTALQRRTVAPSNETLVNDLADVAAQALADLRSISRGQSVYEGGALVRIATRLRVATETVSRLTDCEVDFTVSGDTVVSAALEDDLVAVMWESVANAIRHGCATTVTVALCVDDETLSLVVTDNGRWTATADTASGGLAGLCERAAAWRGRAVVEHGDDLTRVVWRIPLDSTGHPLAGG